MRLIIRISAALLLASALSGCAKPASVGAPGGVENAATGSADRISSHGGPVRSHVGLVDNLRRRGVTVEVSGAAQQPFLATGGTRLRLSDGGLASPAMIESYEYDKAATAVDDAGKIDSDGNPKMYRITWTGPPHFYRSEQLLVLYVGADATVTNLLASLLGAQFAGG